MPARKDNEALLHTPRLSQFQLDADAVFRYSSGRLLVARRWMRRAESGIR
jgi:hypothetical protein